MYQHMLHRGAPWFKEKGGQAGRKWWRKRDAEEAKELEEEEEDEYYMGAVVVGRALRQWMWARDDRRYRKRQMLQPLQEQGWGVVDG